MQKWCNFQIIFIIKYFKFSNKDRDPLYFTLVHFWWFGCWVFLLYFILLVNVNLQNSWNPLLVLSVYREKESTWMYIQLNQGQSEKGKVPYSKAKQAMGRYNPRNKLEQLRRFSMILKWWTFAPAKNMMKWHLNF